MHPASQFLWEVDLCTPNHSRAGAQLEAFTHLRRRRVQERDRPGARIRLRDGRSGAGRQQHRQSADATQLNVGDKGLENPSRDQAKQDERTQAEQL